MDLLSLSFLGLMSNVLDFRTYRYNIELSDEDGRLMDAYDLNAMNQQDRTVCMYVRGMGWTIQKWIDTHYGLENAAGDNVNIRKFIIDYNAHMACAILQYKRQADMQQVKGAPGCTYERLKSQIDMVFLPDSVHGATLQSRLTSHEEIRTMEIDIRGLKLKQISVPEKPKKPLSTKELIRQGESVADERYHKGIEDLFKFPPDPPFGIYLPSVRIIIFN